MNNRRRPTYLPSKPAIQDRIKYIIQELQQLHAQQDLFLRELKELQNLINEIEAVEDQDRPRVEWIYPGSQQDKSASK